MEAKSSSLQQELLSGAWSQNDSTVFRTVEPTEREH